MKRNSEHLRAVSGPLRAVQIQASVYHRLNPTVQFSFDPPAFLGRQCIPGHCGCYRRSQGGVARSGVFVLAGNSLPLHVCSGG